MRTTLQNSVPYYKQTAGLVLQYFIHIHEWCLNKHTFCHYDIDGLVQDCSISIATAPEILQSCTMPSICDTSAYLANSMSTTMNTNIAYIMVYSYVIKKIRNSLWASGKSEHRQCQMMHRLENIYWNNFLLVFQLAYNSHFCRIHCK